MLLRIQIKTLQMNLTPPTEFKSVLDWIVNSVFQSSSWRPDEELFRADKDQRWHRSFLAMSRGLPCFLVGNASNSLLIVEISFERSRRSSKSTIDYERQNREQLREQQLQTREAQRQQEALRSQPQFKMQRFANVPSRLGVRASYCLQRKRDKLISCLTVRHTIVIAAST